MENYKDVIINIRTAQKVLGHELVSIQQEALGRLKLNGGSWSIIYPEPSDTGASKEMTTISSESTKAIFMNKSAGEQMSLLFEEGRQHINRMTTDEGDIDISFLTKKLKMDIGENGGTIDLNYIVSGADIDPVTTTMNFKISPRDIS